MTSNRIPSLFVGHGLPSVALFEDEYSEALEVFGKSLTNLKAIIAISSHWSSPGPIQISSNPRPRSEHNFYGYQEELYKLEYHAQGSPELAEEIASILDEKGFEVSLNAESGLDHGVWIPLRRIRPKADVPVIQLSLPMFATPRVVMNLGHALSELRERGVLILGSGSAAFNPQMIIWSAGSGNPNPKIVEFDQWIKQHFMEAKVEELLNFETVAPNADFAQPTPAHLMPLFFVMGTSLKGDMPSVLYEGYKYHSQSMLTLILGEKLPEPKLTLFH